MRRCRIRPAGRNASCWRSCSALAGIQFGPEPRFLKADLGQVQQGVVALDSLLWSMARSFGAGIGKTPCQVAGANTKALLRACLEICICSPAQTPSTSCERPKSSSRSTAACASRRPVAGRKRGRRTAAPASNPAVPRPAHPLSAPSPGPHAAPKVGAAGEAGSALPRSHTIRYGAPEMRQRPGFRPNPPRAPPAPTAVTGHRVGGVHDERDPGSPIPESARPYGSARVDAGLTAA